MTEWYMGHEPVMQLFWGCAIVATTLFLIQTVMSFIGMDSDADADFGSDVSGDMDGDTLSAGGVMGMFTFRGLVNLVLGFGWTGICCRDFIENTALLVVVAFLVGVLFDFACLFLLQKLMRLEHSGNVLPEDVVGCVATVYLRIPADGVGKIQLSINGSVREYEAVADGEIPTGAHVKVVELLADGTYRVEKM